MNKTAIIEYKHNYKVNFEYISSEELYKWQAVKHFKIYWDAESHNFHEMLSKSLDKTKNLLSSGNYLARRMVKMVTKSAPEEMRALFKMLYDESIDLETRFLKFRSDFIELKEIHTDKKNHYQDDRAIMVYLAMRYPDEYHLYKYEMFKDFTALVDIPYQTVAGRFSNVLKFQDVCKQLKDILIEDDVLLKLHHDRLGEDCYQDPAYTILVQDFIYACVNHLQEINIEEEKPQLINEEFFEFEDFVVEVFESNFKGGNIDHLKKQKQNSITGRAGEDYVLNNEINKLKMQGVKDIYSKIIHTSVVEGDGKGYDIQSVDDNGNVIYIEVKATTGAFNSPFYITRTELECSRVNSENYRLYRVYNFDNKKNEGKLKIFKGCIEPFCKQPENYKVKLKINPAQ